jgi:hypothetical protein
MVYYTVKNPHIVNNVGNTETYFLHPHPFFEVLAGFFAAFAGFFVLHAGDIVILL